MIRGKKFTYIRSRSSAGNMPASGRSISYLRESKRIYSIPAAEEEDQSEGQTLSAYNICRLPEISRYPALPFVLSYFLVDLAHSKKVFSSKSQTECLLCISILSSQPSSTSCRPAINNSSPPCLNIRLN